MPEADAAFAGSIPENYDRETAPADLRGVRPDIARRAAAFAPNAVLEIAAGTGVVTRALAPKLLPGARYVVTDLNQPMLDYAASRQGPDRRITWRQAEALALPFEDAAFDLVCCQFGVMFFPDRQPAYREAKRVLKAGGQFLFNVWDRIEENVFANDVIERARTDFPERSAALPGAHAARLSRYGADPARAGERAASPASSIETRAEQSRAELPRLPAVAYWSPGDAACATRSKTRDRPRGGDESCCGSDREPKRKRRSCCKDPGARDYSRRLGRRPSGRGAATVKLARVS